MEKADGSTARYSQTLPRAALPIIISAPSGAGKSSICLEVIKRLPGISLSVSYTTRPPRSYEIPGKDYIFVSKEEFCKERDAGAFLEWAQVHQNFYGTHRAAVEKELQAGCDVLFDIDIQGGRAILESLPRAVLIFILPPSMAELEQRLRRRHSEEDAAIVARLAHGAVEIKSASFYTYWLVNDDFEQAVDNVIGIIRAERLRNVEKAGVLANLLPAEHT